MENVLLNGYSPEFKEKLRGDLDGALGIVKQGGGDVSHWRDRMSVYLQEQGVENSLKNIKPITPPANWKTFRKPSDMMFGASNNYDAIFNGRAPRHIWEPAFIRLVYTEPDLVRKISEAETRFRGFRYIDSEEAIELAKKYGAKKHQFANHFLYDWEGGDSKDREGEMGYWKISDQMFDSLPWEDLFKSYNKLLNLTDQDDFCVYSRKLNLGRALKNNTEGLNFFCG